MLSLLDAQEYVEMAEQAEAHYGGHGVYRPSPELELWECIEV